MIRKQETPENIDRKSHVSKVFVGFYMSIFLGEAVQLQEVPKAWATRMNFHEPLGGTMGPLMGILWETFFPTNTWGLSQNGYLPQTGHLFFGYILDDLGIYWPRKCGKFSMNHSFLSFKAVRSLNEQFEGWEHEMTAGHRFSGESLAPEVVQFERLGQLQVHAMGRRAGDAGPSQGPGLEHRFVSAEWLCTSVFSMV